MHQKKHILLYTLLLSFALFLTACQGEKKGSEEFEAFTREVFIEEVQCDAITLNYTLTHPENYGITDYTPTFGEFSIEEMQNSYAEMENYLAALKEFDYNSLTEDQQLTYDIFKEYLELQLSADDYILYLEALGPNTGLQAQLPVLLAEYHFTDKEDVESYLLLLEDLPRYFGQIADFEVQKSKAGLFMSDTTADSIISQCEKFLASREDNVLIEVFNDRVETLSFLTVEEKETFKKQNQNLVFTSVIPAYELLIEQIEALKGTGTNDGGLCNFPKGKEYYEYLIASTTGSSHSMKEIDEMLANGINTGIENMIEAANGDSTVFEKVDTVVYPLTDPTESIEFLKVAIQENYPALEDVNYNIKYVHKSLEEDLSPAFYLTPPLDNYSENSIYINGYSEYSLDDIFPTLAHEGYPGHLFQNVYFNQSNPDPLRMLLNFGGYSEGWATYVEMDSYSMMEMDQQAASIIMNNQMASLCMYAQMDLGINYYGWDLEDTLTYLTNFGIDSEEAAKEVYQTMVAEPGNYMKYALGYLEIVELREQAEKKLGDDFSLKEWNTFFLDMGPAQFEVIEKYMEVWIKEQ